MAYSGRLIQERQLPSKSSTRFMYLSDILDREVENLTIRLSYNFFCRSLEGWSKTRLWKLSCYEDDPENNCQVK